ncbi:MarC family protein [Aestuariivirga sp.]|uniref:MarC family protein n=1 Tax=Aestuariivirga sp. TaxID=2650926 RepID=UPI00301A6341
MLNPEVSFQHYLLGLLAVANNISAVAPFIRLVSGMKPLEVSRINLIASFACFVVMVVSMLTGSAVLDFFGISISAFRIAGGILLGVVGLSMMHSTNSSCAGKEASNDVDDFSSKESQAIVPICIPLTAGPGTISTITLFSASAKTSHTEAELFAAICVMSILIFLIFHFALPLVKVIGEIGMNVMMKVMGLITLAIGVQFVIQGVSTIYRGLIGA